MSIKITRKTILVKYFRTNDNIFIIKNSGYSEFAFTGGETGFNNKLVLLNVAERLIISIALLLKETWKLLSGDFVLI